MDPLICAIVLWAAWSTWVTWTLGGDREQIESLRKRVATLEEDADDAIEASARIASDEQEDWARG